MKASFIKFQCCLLLFAVAACTDIIQILDDSKPDEILVVEGEITDQPSPYIIKLSTTSNLAGLGSNTLGLGASVIIEESTGKEEVLTEISPGVYQTNTGGIQGEIGKSYRVRIMLSNGEQYQSVFETIPEPADIISLNAELIDERFEIDGVAQRRIGHLLSANMVKEKDVHKFFQFRGEAIQEVEVGFGFCELPVRTLCYAVRNPLQSQIVLFDDTEIRQDSYPTEIAFIPVEQKRRYLAKIETYSFSSNAYNFWSGVQSQLTKKGDIFDSPLSPVIGNIKNIATNVFAQGYFMAASISRNQICIDRSNILIAINIPTAPCVESGCTQVWSPASFIMPDFGFCQ